MLLDITVCSRQDFTSKYQKAAHLVLPVIRKKIDTDETFKATHFIAKQFDLCFESFSFVFERTHYTEFHKTVKIYLCK